MYWIKNTIIIVMIFFTPLLIIDGVFLYGKLGYRVHHYQCDSNLTNYNYCPSFTHLNYMSLADKWFPVSNFVDQNRRATYKGLDNLAINNQNFFDLFGKSDINPDKYKLIMNNDESGQGEIREVIKKRIYLIGDSFIQAEEMKIESRFEHYLREKGYEVIALGYASWNSVQYHSIIKSLELNENDYVFVFSMGNDYTPSYDRSSINTILDDRKDENLIEDIDKSLIYKIFKKIYINSLILNTYRRAKQQIYFMFKSKDIKDNLVKKIEISHNIENLNNCSSIPLLKNVGSEAILDYIYLSKSSKCWSDTIKNSVDFNVNLLTEMQKIVENQGATFNIGLISAGWAFKNENTIGRMSLDYLVPKNKIISQVGLSRYLKRFNLPVIDLEELLRQNKSSHSNDLHYPADGHWNERAHKIIGKHLEEYLN